jgi:endothelin-converting enzyme
LEAADVLDSNFAEGGWLSATFTQPQADADRSNFALLQRAYRTCMRNDATAGLKGLKTVVKTIADLYPTQQEKRRRRRGVLDDGDARAAALGRTLAYFIQHGLPSIVYVIPQPAFPGLSSTRVPPAADQPSKPPLLVAMGLDPDDANFRFVPSPKYYDLGAEILASVHPSSLGPEAARSLMKRVVDLEMQLQAPSTGARDDPRQVKLRDLDKLSPQLNLSYAIRSMGYEPEEVLVYRPNLLANTSRTLFSNVSDSTLQGFFMWKAIKKLAPWVGAEVTNNFVHREDSPTVERLYSGNAEACIAAIDQGPWTKPALQPDVSTMTWTLGRFFVEKAYPPAAQNTTLSILRNVQRHFEERVGQTPWLSNATRHNAAEFIKRVKPNLGYNHTLIDPLFLQQRMAELAPALSDSHVDNAMALARADMTRTWTALTRPAVYREPDMSTLTVNAKYERLDHTISVPAGMMQALPRDVVPSFAAYGYYGTILGHELGHILDGNTMSLDAAGWDAPSVQALANRSGCMVKQYNDFTFAAPDGAAVHILGNVTLGENMADMHGLHSGYAAWKELQGKPETRDPGLPGLEAYTTDQLFFITCKAALKRLSLTCHRKPTNLLWV